jgi:hypothetical protein
MDFRQDSAHIAVLVGAIGGKPAVSDKLRECRSLGGHGEPILAEPTRGVSGSADPCAVDRTLDRAGATQE